MHASFDTQHGFPPAADLQTPRPHLTEPKTVQPPEDHCPWLRSICIPSKSGNLLVFPFLMSSPTGHDRKICICILHSAFRGQLSLSARSAATASFEILIRLVRIVFSLRVHQTSDNGLRFLAVLVLVKPEAVDEHEVFRAAPSTLDIFSPAPRR